MPKRYNAHPSGSEKNRKPRREPATRRRSDASSTYYRDIGGGRTLSVSQQRQGNDHHVFLNIKSGKPPSKHDGRKYSRSQASPMSARPSDYKPRYRRDDIRPPSRIRPQHGPIHHDSYYAMPPSGHYKDKAYAPLPSYSGYPLRHPRRRSYHDDVVSSDDDLARVYNAPYGCSMMDIVTVTAEVEYSHSREFGLPELQWEGYGGRMKVTKPCANNARNVLIRAVKLYKHTTGLKVREGDILSMTFKRNHHKVPSRDGHTTIVEAFQPLWDLSVTHANPGQFWDYLRLTFLPYPALRLSQSSPKYTWFVRATELLSASNQHNVLQQSDAYAQT